MSFRLICLFLMLLLLLVCGCVSKQPYTEHRFERLNGQTGERVIVTTKMYAPENAQEPSSVNVDVQEGTDSSGKPVMRVTSDIGMSPSRAPDIATHSLWMLPWIGVALFVSGVVLFGVRLKWLKNMPIGWVVGCIAGGVALFIMPKLVQELQPVPIALAALLGFGVSWRHNRSQGFTQNS